MTKQKIIKVLGGAKELYKKYSRATDRWSFPCEVMGTSVMRMAGILTNEQVKDNFKLIKKY